MPCLLAGLFLRASINGTFRADIPLNSSYEMTTAVGVPFFVITCGSPFAAEATTWLNLFLPSRTDIVFMFMLASLASYEELWTNMVILSMEYVGGLTYNT